MEFSASFQAIDFNTESYLNNDNGEHLTRKAMIRFWSHYEGFNCASRQAVDILEMNKHLPESVRRRYSINLGHTSDYNDFQDVKNYFFSQPIGLEFGFIDREIKPDYQNAIESQLGLNSFSSESHFWWSINSVFLSPNFAPLMTEDFKGLPETLIYVGKQDVLRDDSIWLALRLLDVNVKVYLEIDPYGDHTTIYNSHSELEIRQKLLDIYQEN